MVGEPYWHGAGAVHATSARLRRTSMAGEAAQYVVAMATTTSTAIGVSRRRSDGEGKVRGSTRFAADLPVHGLLHARLVLAAEAHGRIAGIDGSAALDVAGVVAVLTAADLPFVDGAAGRAGQPLARSEIVYSGQPGALVVAEAEAAAADAAGAAGADGWGGDRGAGSRGRRRGPGGRRAARGRARPRVVDGAGGGAGPG